MAALVKAAKAEGHLNVITLPTNWANYGAIMKEFTAKYGIKITDANPDGSSQDEINAMEQDKGQSRAPDVLDMGTAFAIEARPEGPAGPVRGGHLERHPGQLQGRRRRLVRRLRRLRGHRLRPSKVKVAPTSFKDLLNPIYKHQVAINGNPTQASAAFSAVYAAALANGGSLSNIAPGIQFFKKLHKAGNFVPVTAGPTTVESGQHPDRGLVGLPAGLRDQLGR